MRDLGEGDLPSPDFQLLVIGSIADQLRFRESRVVFSLIASPITLLIA
ncbi:MULTISPECIES: hypothetical protein [unclassified Bifidobacterium]|nr:MULTISPECIES: hypothetical protein [unclassified Bifidobacterium]